MRSEIENPFYQSELYKMFEKQRDKVEFEVKKEVKDKSGKAWTLTVDGRSIGSGYYDEELKLPMPTHEIKRPPQSWCYVEEMRADG